MNRWESIETRSQHPDCPKAKPLIEGIERRHMSRFGIEGGNCVQAMSHVRCRETHGDASMPTKRALTACLVIHITGQV